MLFSATTSAKTEALLKLALKKEPVYVGVDDSKEMATVEGLEQGYVICPSEKRFLLLFTFLKKNKNKKVSTEVFLVTQKCQSITAHHFKDAWLFRTTGLQILNIIRGLKAF